MCGKKQYIYRSAVSGTQGGLGTFPPWMEGATVLLTGISSRSEPLTVGEVLYLGRQRHFAEVTLLDIAVHVLLCFCCLKESQEPGREGGDEDGEHPKVEHIPQLQDVLPGPFQPQLLTLRPHHPWVGSEGAHEIKLTWEAATRRLLSPPHSCSAPCWGGQEHPRDKTNPPRKAPLRKKLKAESASRGEGHKVAL